MAKILKFNLNKKTILHQPNNCLCNVFYLTTPFLVILTEYFTTLVLLTNIWMPSRAEVPDCIGNSFNFTKTPFARFSRHAVLQRGSGNERVILNGVLIPVESHLNFAANPFPVGQRTAWSDPSSLAFYPLRAVFKWQQPVKRLTLISRLRSAFLCPQENQSTAGETC